VQDADGEGRCDDETEAGQAPETGETAAAQDAEIERLLFLLGEQVKKVQTSTLAKPTTNPKTKRCPKCGAVAGCKHQIGDPNAKL
jgi:hypothetical protein